MNSGQCGERASKGHRKRYEYWHYFFYGGGCDAETELRELNETEIGPRPHGRSRPVRDNRGAGGGASGLWLASAKLRSRWHGADMRLRIRRPSRPTGGKMSDLTTLAAEQRGKIHDRVRRLMESIGLACDVFYGRGSFSARQIEQEIGVLVIAAVEARDDRWICSIAKVLGAFCLSSGDIEGSVRKYIEAGQADAVEAATGELHGENERLREVLRACDSILTAQGFPNNAAHAALKGKP